MVLVENPVSLSVVLSNRSSDDASPMFNNSFSSAHFPATPLPRGTTIDSIPSGFAAINISDTWSTQNKVTCEQYKISRATSSNLWTNLDELPSASLMIFGDPEERRGAASLSPLRGGRFS